MFKKIFSLAVITALTMSMIGCSSKSELAVPTATITVEGYGNIVAELYPEKAPNTVNNFIELSETGFYNGLTFHRVIDDFVIQGGCPEGNGLGDPGYSIKGEFSNNGFVGNDITHVNGTLSMARSSENDSAGSQFFIVTGDAKYLDSDYAGFGKVVSGIELLDKLEKVETDEMDKPSENIVIKEIKIDRKGYSFKSVNKIEEKK